MTTETDFNIKVLHTKSKVLEMWLESLTRILLKMEDQLSPEDKNTLQNMIKGVK